MLHTLGISTTLASAEKHYTILLKEGKDWKGNVKAIEDSGGEIVYQVEEIGLLQVNASEKAMNRLKALDSIESYNPSVRTVESSMANDLEKSVSSPPYLWDLQWDMSSITHDGKSYSLYDGSKNVTVGIIDSGITSDHKDLVPSIVQGSKNFVPKGGFRGEEIEETGNVNQIRDLTGHGTHVAGQIAADGLMKGVAPGIGIKSYRVFGSGSAETIWIIKAIIEAAKDDVDVINLSLGSYLIKGVKYSFEGKSRADLAEIKAYEKAIEFANKRGSAIVAAVGNDSLNEKDRKEVETFLEKTLEKDGITFKGKGYDVPASLKGVIAVSSTGPTNELSLFSNYGKNIVDIAAPGGDYRLFEKYGFEKWLDESLIGKEHVLSTSPDGAYYYAAGTSVAAPKVSGTLALIIEKNHLKDQPTKSEKILYKYGVNKEIPKNKGDFGNGILDVYNALSY